MKTMNVSIKGSEWGIRFLSLKQFLKSNADQVVEGEEFYGITKKGSKVIEFVLNKITHR